MITLESENARVRVDEEIGARLASLEVNGFELLVGQNDSEVASGPEGLLAWGSYPMVPWASRVRNGLFELDGKQYSLPLRMPPHAIHGTVLDRVWAVESVDESHCTLSIDLGSDWPWAGEARQKIELSESGLLCALEIHTANAYFPYSLGWHPWFRRRLRNEAEAVLSFSPGKIYLRDADDIPTGETATPGPGPYDDTFTEVKENPAIRWPGALSLTLSSDLDHWVIYDALPHALCVEPLSGPPDALNLAPQYVERQRPASGRFQMTWCLE
ncbi:MAG: aldose 1-epimerase [Myxococcota bacterium]